MHGLVAGRVMCHWLPLDEETPLGQWPVNRRCVMTRARYSPFKDCIALGYIRGKKEGKPGPLNNVRRYLLHALWSRSTSSKRRSLP